MGLVPTSGSEQAVGPWWRGLLVVEPWRLALELAERLATVGSRAERFAATFDVLGRAIPGNATFWTTVDLASGVSTAVRETGPDPVLAAGLSTSAYDHPGVLSYVRDPTDLTPRRISDVTSLADWRRTTAYGEVFRGGDAEHQLSMVVRLRAPVVGAGWVVGRAGSDFGDAEVETARHLLPVLTVGVARWALPEVSTPHAGAALHLSAREARTLELLAGGHTASAIARRMGVSVSTVRKHLDSLYRKMEVRDRLTAVERARTLGLLSAPSPVGAW